MEHKKWVILCIIGGILMVLSSLIGSLGFIGTVLKLAAGVLGPEMQQIISNLLTVLGYIAAGGGISVILGALIAGFGPDRLGRIIIALGIGINIIGLIIILVTNIIGGSSINDLLGILISTFNGGYGLAGVSMSIVSRMKMKD
ncbi:MAG: hypothetical protein ACXACC_06345 [Promethearchaeota archaeon]|jgi:hypothetical protein